MDIQKLLSELLSADSVKGMSKASGASQKDVKKVVAAVLPSLLGGAKGQAEGSDTAEGFTQALSDHAKADTSDIKSFLANVDLDDGAKIIGHLLGGNQENTTKAVSAQTGVSAKKTGNILSSLAPLLMSLLGQQTGSDNSGSSIGGLMGSLLGNVDITSLLGGLLGGGSGNSSSAKPNLGSLLGGLLGGSSKPASSSSSSSSSGKKKDSLGTLVGGLLKNFLKKK